MSRLAWGEPGARYYETGVDRGVLYVDNDGVPWNGLVSISEKASGGEPRPYYLDGIKYLNLAASEEFEATLEAFAAPVEFGPCDGTRGVAQGLFVTQQPRKAFGLSYRTLIGNDTEGQNHGYKIHLVYNALAGPAEKANTTKAADVTLTSSSWDLTTLPPSLTGMKPTAHFVIDSRTTPDGLLEAIENILYGSDEADPRMPLASELVALFKSPGYTRQTNLALNPSFRLASTTQEVLRNQIKNPSFRAVNGTVEVRRNIATNPGGETTSGWSSNNSTNHVMSQDTTFKKSGSASFKSTPQSPSIGTVRTLMSSFDVGGIGLPATAGKIYTVSAQVAHNTSAAEGNICISFLDSTGAVLSTQNQYVFVPISAGQTWTRISYTTTAAPANTATIRVLLYVQKTAAAGNVAANEFAWGDECLVEESTVLAPYFDGTTTSVSGDFTYAWVGTANASASIKRGVLVTNLSTAGNASLIQSTFWKRPNRSYSLRMASQYAGNGSGYIDLARLTSGTIILTQGKTYTVAAWFYSDPANPNTAGGFQFTTTVSGTTSVVASKYVAPGGGEQFLSLTFTVPTGATLTDAYLRVNNMLAKNVADIWLSDLILVEGYVLPPFFDGNTVATDLLTYSWTGAADNSASIAVGNKVNNWTGSAYPASITKGPKLGNGYCADLRGVQFYTDPLPDVAVGDFVSARATLRAIPGESLFGDQYTVSVRLHDGTNYISAPISPVLPADGSPVTVDAIANAPSSSSNVRLFIYPNYGNSVRVNEVIAQEVAAAGIPAVSFFDGNTPSADGYNYSWSGSPDASSSLMGTWYKDH